MHLMSLRQLYICNTEIFSLSEKFYEINCLEKGRFWEIEFLQEINKINISSRTWKIKNDYVFHFRIGRFRFS